MEKERQAKANKSVWLPLFCFSFGKKIICGVHDSVCLQLKREESENTKSES